MESDSDNCAIASVALVVVDDQDDEHLQMAANYSRNVDCKSAVCETYRLSELFDMIGTVDALVFYTHGCLAAFARCPEYCSNQLCFRGADDKSVLSVAQAAARCKVAIYGATSCYTSVALSNSSINSLGYSADFRHVFVPSDQTNPFEDIVNAPFQLDPVRLQEFAEWHIAVTERYEYWLNHDHGPHMTEWQQKNWWLVEYCLKHNFDCLTYHEANEIDA